MLYGLNCDCGESYGRLSVGQDELVIPLIESANIACGFHGGDPSTIRHTVRLAKAHGVTCGAHPSLPDLMGFGRRVMSIEPSELTDLMIYQIGAVRALIEAEGLVCKHVKPHGVLYSMLEQENLAEAFADAIIAVDSNIAWICDARSMVAQVAARRGLRVLNELTVDRAYDENGKLIITRIPERVDPAFAVGQIQQFVETGTILTSAGTPLSIPAEIICIHSDTPNSPEIAAALRLYLEGIR